MGEAAVKAYFLNETLVPTLVLRTGRTIVELQAGWLGWLTLSPRIRVSRLVLDEMGRPYWRQSWCNRYF